MKFLKKLAQDESGQATTEYMMLIAIATGFAIIVLKTLKPMMATLTTAVTASINSAIFGADLSTFKLGK